MTDKQQNTVAVSVYNLADGKGVIIGDAVAIPEPYFFQKHVSHKEKVRVIFVVCVIEKELLFYLFIFFLFFFPLL